MARPLLLPVGFADHDFLEIIRTEPNARARIRLLAMYHLQRGKRLQAVAEITQVHWQTVQAWLRRFRILGLASIYDLPRSGAPEKITGTAKYWLSDKIQALSEAKTGGYITGKELQKLLLAEHGVSCTLKTIYNKLHQLNFSWITSRSIHTKSNIEVQEAYKKNFTIC
jgi:transposase